MSIALICPRDNLAGFISNDEDNVVLVNRATGAHLRFPSCGVFSRFPDCTVVEAESDADAAEKLAQARERSATLDFLLILFDAELPIDVRAEAAKILDDLLCKVENVEYALEIVLAIPLSEDADVNGARQVSEESAKVAELIDLIIECTPRSKLALNAWLAIRSHSLMKPEDRDLTHARFISHGVFRRIVKEGRTRADVERVVGQLAVELNGIVDGRLLREFANQYKSSLPKGNVSRLTPASVESAEFVNEPGAVVARALPARERTNADALALWAASQVESIANRYRVGDDQIAERFLNELVESQTQGASSFEHVVKSLCNLSTKCSTVGREELCMPILHRAFQFSSGVDAKAFTLLADEFYRAKDLKKADDCYTRALELESEHYFKDAILRKRIRVSVASGEYEKAIKAYHSISDVFDEAGFLTDQGTLLRRMAKFNDARTCFRKVIAMQPDRYQAFAGIAEVDKQSGKLHRSLKRYNKILDNFKSSLEPRSKKVYQLSQAFLYQITQQFPRSYGVLSKLHSHYEYDRSVNFQLGKLLVLMGRASDAKPYIEQSQRTAGEDLREAIFALAMGNLLDYVKPTDQKDLSSYLPEERGLATCGRAFDAILRNSFEEAWNLMAHVRHYNRLHEDFGLVLGYHARKRMDFSLSYKREQRLARIAKQGYPELRLGILAIESQDFSSAIGHERRMLQLVT